MVARNPNLAKLHSGYLFPEIAKRKRAFLEKNPHAKIISLGIGDTTEPLSEQIVNGLRHGSERLGKKDTYSGYGPEQGELELREKIASFFYHHKIDSDEIFISDGSKCDIGRLQILFGKDSITAVQDPTYPVYVDTSVILGQTGLYHAERRQYQGVVYMPCLPESRFFPDLSKIPPCHIIYFCSPNNPTGATATYDQLNSLVKYAKKNGSIIIFDAAYAAYIQDPNLPRSIYEIAGARQVAIELGSFSKMAGFTGVRLAWSIIPKELQFDDGHSVHYDWNRINSTFFNGASNIAQKGGMAVMSTNGLNEVQKMVRYYMENAKLLKNCLIDLGYEVYGGEHIPYLWVKSPYGNSWDGFDYLLNQTHILSTPGSGFGPAGEGFLRFSAFAQRPHVEEAIERLRGKF